MTNMHSVQDSIFNTEVNNKGFAILDTLFKEKGWHLIKNDMNRICYSKFGNETDFFDIKISQKAIHISIPLKNSSYQYNTLFSDYFQASEYVESRFLDFIEEKKMI